MKKSVNLYFDYNVDSKLKLDEIKNLGYDEFYTGLYDAKETLKFHEQFEYAKKLGLECSMIHCSYFEPELNNFWLDNEIGDKVMNSYISQIKESYGLSKNFVVHLNGSKDSVVSEIGLERIKKILKACEENDINLCIENLYSEEEIPYIFENIKHKNLKICFDTGHKNFLTQNFDLMKRYGEFVTVLHIHDNDGKADLHDIIGNGTIDLEKLANNLSKFPNLVLSAEIKTKGQDYKEFLKDNLIGLNKLEEKIKKYSKN